MAKEKEEKQERRRFERTKEEKPWEEKDRARFLDIAGKLAPFVRHIATPPPAEKKKDDFGSFLDGLLK